MNKDLLDQLSADERAAAEKLSAAAEMMKLSQSFRSNLETQLMDAYPSQNEKQNSLMKFLKPVGLVMAVVAAVLLANWIFGSLLPGIQPGANPSVTPEVPFEANVRQGNICAAPLAVSHGFGVFLTSPDKAQFAAIDAGNTIGEMRSFTWSADGKQLFILGNTLGSGNIYQADPTSGQVEPILPLGELGYMMDAGWSQDGKHIAMWSAQNNKVLYIVNSDGTGPIEKSLYDTHIMGAPQFLPDGSSVIFLGAMPTLSGLIELTLNSPELRLISPSVESSGSFAFSPNGEHLAYMEYNRELGEGRLIMEDLASGKPTMLGSFPIPKGSGSSVPQTANMSWSADGTSILFDVGRGANDRVIYLARVDGTELVKIVDSGYAPAISPDGNCLAYIKDKQLMLLGLRASWNSVSTTPIVLADLPVGRGNPNYQLDKLQWRPTP